MGEKEEKLAKYPKTENFEVIDTIGVPHAFMIGTGHVGWASDNHSGILGEAAIEAYEKHLGRPSCKHPRCNLPYGKHEQALLVKCKTKDTELTRAYLLSIVKMCEEDGFAGFTLMDATGGKP